MDGITKNDEIYKRLVLIHKAHLERRLYSMTKLEKIKTYLEVQKELKESMTQSLCGALREAKKEGNNEYCDLLEKSIIEFQAKIDTYKKVLKLFEID